VASSDEDPRIYMNYRILADWVLRSVGIQAISQSKEPFIYEIISVSSGVRPRSSTFKRTPWSEFAATKNGTYHRLSITEVYNLATNIISAN
jgi:hypothetical protein